MTDELNKPEAAQRQDGKTPAPGWEKDLVNRLAFASLNEQRRARRWGLLFKGLLLLYLVVLLVSINRGPWPGKSVSTKAHTALVEVRGIIADNTDASARIVLSGLHAAYEDKKTKGIILRINSPGGSPVQAGYIYDEILRLKEKYPDTPLYAVVADICASGGYYVAVAADQIYADKASIVGSIGVRMDGFGFVDTLEKLGVERRLLTAGENKGLLDPFSPAKKTDVSHIQSLLDGIHQQFIEVVKAGRKDRLLDNPDIFSGLVWTGEQGVQLGLVDGLGNVGFVARELIGAEEVVDFTPRQHWFERFGDRFGAAVGKGMAAWLGNQLPALQ